MRSCPWSHTSHEGLRMQMEIHSLYASVGFSHSLRFYSINNSLCITPAVIYCDGAFAPEDRRAPEYLEEEGKISP